MAADEPTIAVITRDKGIWLGGQPHIEPVNVTMSNAIAIVLQNHGTVKFPRRLQRFR